jgi:hypothetical protein
MTFNMRPSPRTAAARRVSALSPAVLKTTTVLSPTMASTRSIDLTADEALCVGPNTYTDARRTAVLALGQSRCLASRFGQSRGYQEHR